MQQIDVILNLLLPTLVVLYLLAAPFTKVEESFNIQATHDILTYGWPFRNVSSTLRQNYDHFEFPGAVPRTFVGAASLAGTVKPILYLFGKQHTQLIVRAVLGLSNALALFRYKQALENAFGKGVGRWYILLQASQFHVIYYASRTLPNMFAFRLTTQALTYFLPINKPLGIEELEKKQNQAIFQLVFAGVVFRSEIAILVLTQYLYLLFQSRVELRTIVKLGIANALTAVVVTVAMDSYFWQTLTWPELSGLYYNVVLGKSKDWGTSPFHYYFTSAIPRLLLNPLTYLLLIPISLRLPAFKSSARDLVIPHLAFITIYSLQPHKEARFIIYSVPALTAAASLSASYIWTRRSKAILYALASILLVISVAASFAASAGILLISSLNYPGGQALSQLHTLLNKTPWPESSIPSTGRNTTIKIHMDVLSCMTGVTRFQQLPSTPELPVINNRPTHIVYDKTEDPDQLLRPEFWAQFDYLLMEDPGKAIGAWEVVDSVYAYSGIEFLRPGDGSSFSEKLERVYAANNITVSKANGGDGKAPSGQEVKKALEEGKGIDPEFRKKGDAENVVEDVEQLRARLLLKEMSTFGTYNLIRDGFRKITRGWWIGPRMEIKIRILKRVEDPLAV